MDDLALKLSPRTITRKKVKGLRRNGVVPVHLYGRGTESQSLQVDVGVLRRVLNRAGGNVPITVEVEGQKGENICFVREVQRHPVTEDLLHVDFLWVDVSRMMRAEIPILLRGDAPAVRNLGGTLLQPLASLEVESLPMNMPASFELDVSGLDDFEKAVRVGDIQVDANVTVLREASEMVARVARPRVEEEPEVGEEIEELEEGVEGAEVDGEAEAPGQDAGGERR